MKWLQTDSAGIDNAERKKHRKISPGMHPLGVISPLHLLDGAVAQTLTHTEVMFPRSF